MSERMRHHVTGRFMAGDCEKDCIEHCAGLCGATPVEFTEPPVMAPLNEWENYCPYGSHFPDGCHPCHMCVECEADLERIALENGW